MKRPRRPSISALSLVAISLSSLTHRHPGRYRHLFGSVVSAASLRATQSPAADDSSSSGGSDEEPRSSSPLHQKKQLQLTVKLSASSHPRAAHSTTHTSTSSFDRSPEIPLIGIGVGNLPHGKVPYILASALGLPSKNSKKKKGNNSGGVDVEDLNYRLVDTSHAADSALEVLVGRSLSRVSTASSTASSASGDNGSGNTSYHVMIKIWHTHLGYERTMLSIQDSLSDILPGFKGNKDNNNDDVLDAIKKYKSGLGNTNTGTAGGNNNHPDVKVHAILQYPRCDNSFFSSSQFIDSPNFPNKFDNCQEEEDSLDEATKKAGPSPLADKENSWKRSYRALEELYHHGTLESIGVSNFGPADLSELFDLAAVGPHVYQGSLDTLLIQEEMVEELVRHGVHYQCYDAVSTILEGREGAPKAYAKLERMGAKHGSMMDREDDDWYNGSNGGENENDLDSGMSDASDVYGYGYSAVQVVLGWLIHHRGVGVVPGTSNAAHLAENSPRSLGTMPRFSPREALDVEMAVLGLAYGDEEEIENDAIKVAIRVVGGEGGGEEAIDLFGALHRGDGDMNGNGSGNSKHDEAGEEERGGVVATFFNALPSRSVRIFRIHPDTGEQVQISHSIPPGRSGRMLVNAEDVLVAYDGHGAAVKKFLAEVDGNASGSLDFSVES